MIFCQDRATLNALSARHGGRPGPKLAPSVQAAALRGPQPRAGANTATGREKVAYVLKRCLWYRERQKFPFGVWLT